jgi:hypothetical protein
VQFPALLRFEQRDKFAQLLIDLKRSGREGFIVKLLTELIAYCLLTKNPALQFVDDLNATSPYP